MLPHAILVREVAQMPIEAVACGRGPIELKEVEGEPGAALLGGPRPFLEVVAAEPRDQNPSGRHEARNWRAAAASRPSGGRRPAGA